MKKYIVIPFLFMILLIGGLILFSNKNEEKEEIYIEDNTSVTLINDKIFVFGIYSISSIISLENGEIINDQLIDTNKIGLKTIEVLYKDINEIKKKAIVEVNIVDEVKPLILGSSIVKVIKGEEDKIKYKLFSADNYDQNPQREIIGDYNLNKIGIYQLTLKVTDSSNNVSNKSFSLHVLNKMPNSKPSTTTTIYKEIVEKNKTENTEIGLDISRWQENIDFELLKENGVEFIMMRVGVQKGFNGELGLDSFFLRNVEQANLFNIPVGGYFYSYATSESEAIDQAKWVIEQIKDYQIELPIAFDWEVWSNFSSLSLSLKDINNIAKAFMDEIISKNYKAMNYGSKFYLENIWDLDDYPTWLAHYTKETDYQKEYIMWQLCNNGIIPGIKGKVDINVLYK